jgi:tRNA(Ile2) C34 agmatinyltransferase TiaS
VTAQKYGIEIFGGRGVIGAIAAIALRTQSQEVLLDLTNPVKNG